MSSNNFGAALAAKPTGIDDGTPQTIGHTPVIFENNQTPEDFPNRNERKVFSIGTAVHAYLSIQVFHLALHG
jgi:hypothetical protein